MKTIKKKMKNALRRQERHDHESPRELERQNEAQRMVVPQSGAKNVCRHKCNLKKSRLLIAQDTQQKIRGCVLVPRTQLYSHQ